MDLRSKIVLIYGPTASGKSNFAIKLAKKKFKFFEVGISYRGRSYSEGKKITAKDAIIALFCIFKYGLFG